MDWKIEFRPSARRQFRDLDDSAKLEARDALKSLAEDPFLHDSLELTGHSDVRRVKFYRGQYRMVYRVLPARHKVIILRVRLRASAYDGY